MRLNRIVSILLLGLVAAVPTQNAVAQETSTPEERAQWAAITHKLESAPLDDNVNQQGEAGLKRLSDVHDIHVPLCPAILSEFNGMKYAYTHMMTRQYMLASAAFLIGLGDRYCNRLGMDI